MQRGFSVMLETFTCAIVLIARANMARKALKRSAARRLPKGSAQERIRSSYKYN